MSRSARRASNPTARAAAAFARRTLGASLFMGVVMSAQAQQSDGMIVIPGNAETSPAAAADMAQRLNASPAPRAPAPVLPMQSGYRAATKAADAAMRNAALELEARADAADDSMNDASGMIVIPGPTEAKPARVAAPAASASPAVAPSPSRDVIPVVVARDEGIARGANAKPVAASPASPIRRVSFSPSTPVAAAPQASNANANPNAAMQDGEAIRVAALNFLQQQAAGLPGKVEITVTPVFPRGLAACSALDPFMPTGARLWGRMTVGVRCVGERPWTLYVQARVSINATYYQAARAIAPGEVLTNADLVARDGDITAMPQAIVTDPAQAVGAVALSRVPAGLPLRTDMLRAASSVAIGQNVHVVAGGSGFSISAEGTAMNNAAPGQQIRVKTAGGQIITGVVKDAQTVEVSL
jgi:flagellar basal body P-ring formation protein FlgA